MLAAAGQHQIADLNDVPAVGRNRERQQRVGAIAKVVVVRDHSAQGVEQRQDGVGLRAVRWPP